MSYSVYVIRSVKDRRFYTGISNEVERRVREHNEGSSSTPSTRHRGPFLLVYREDGLTREAARIREKFLKSGVGREFRNRILKHNLPG